MSRSDSTRPRADAPWMPAGPGMAITWQCMGCQQKRTTAGARGTGIRRRCAVCVSKKGAPA